MMSFFQKIKRKRKENARLQSVRIDAIPDLQRTNIPSMLLNSIFNLFNAISRLYAYRNIIEGIKIRWHQRDTDFSRNKFRTKILRLKTT